MFFIFLTSRYSTGNERQTPTGGTISEQIYLGFTKNKHSTDVLSPRAIAHKLFSFQLLKRGPWKKVVHPPSTTFPPLSFDKKFHPLYIDFMLKYFQNQNIFTIVNFNWESLILKIFQHKVYIKGMKFLVKAQWRKSCWGGMYYFFPGTPFQELEAEKLMGGSPGGEDISTMFIFCKT